MGTVCFTTTGFIFTDNMEPDTDNRTSPRSSSVSVPGLADCSLSGGVKITSEVATNPPIHPDSEFDISVINLPEKLGFSVEFQAELKSMGGDFHSLATKFLNSFNLDDSGKFKAGQLCATPKYCSKILDAGPMVTRWLTTGYEIPSPRYPQSLSQLRIISSSLVSLLTSGD